MIHLSTRRLAVSSLAVLLAGCAPTVQTSATPATPPIPAVERATVRPDATWLLPPALAFQRALMPLAPTGVPAFLQAHPTWDGRGVLIAILDSGTDPTVDGLLTTSTGEPKILDARDFSGEGAIPLERVTPQGDMVTIRGKSLSGFGRLLGINAAGPWYAGVLRETPLGEAPASDVNWNNIVGDTLPVLVTHASDGWVLLADLDGDGSLLNEKPIHDYLVARETFGWAPKGHRPALGFAANLTEQGGEPKLDLFFDNSAHGTHTAGIAAAHAIGGVDGFDGVAPGAQLLALKIANDAQGGISTTGAMLAALDYAIRIAGDRHLPLVVNMSFGVGNEQEGAARIDQLFDSVLALHPDVLFAISAGNDGPGISTLGFPGSATRVLSVGATLPRIFFSRDPGPDPIAFFSSRGGEVARPDLITPGVAFSTVPRWNQGDEAKQGTSMASPHAAGLAALLVSALTQSGKPVVAARIRQALTTTAQPIDGLSIIDQGTGVPNVGRAWHWLEGNFAWTPARAEAIGQGGTRTGAAFRGNGLAAGDTLQRFTVTLEGGATGPVDLTARSDAPWLHVAPRQRLTNGTGTITLSYDASAMKNVGDYVGTVTLWGRDTMAGPVARLVNTVVVPYPAGGEATAAATSVSAGLERHWSFGAQADRPFEVSVWSSGPKDLVRAFLHEPGGEPFQGGYEKEGSSGANAATFRLDARDVIAGNYEIVAAAPPIANSSAGMHIVHAPFTLVADLRGGQAIAALRNVTAAPITVTVGGTIVEGAH
ncbi:MAG: S8 family serine peptidase [Gemmatimonadetes bacterium]|nr:S8 family serine peptidase [Gemmatimonadota bacterium]